MQHVLTEAPRAKTVHLHSVEVDGAARASQKRQTPCVLWFTGLSGAGKSTLSTLVDQKLFLLGHHTYVLDGDNVRHGLNRDLGFSEGDRVENVRRVAEVAKLFIDAGLVVLVSLISPFRSDRRAARELFSEGHFLEIFVEAPLELCMARDPKRLYERVRRGEIKNFTGIDSPYEPPESPELVLNTSERSADALAEQVITCLRHRALVQSRP